VRDFVEAAFKVVDLPWKKYVKQDPAFDRPIEPTRLVGCADKIRKTLAWKPNGNFEQLVREMVGAEVETIEKLKTETLKRKVERVRVTSHLALCDAVSSLAR